MSVDSTVTLTVALEYYPGDSGLERLQGESSEVTVRKLKDDLTRLGLPHPKAVNIRISPVSGSGSLAELTWPEQSRNSVSWLGQCYLVLI